MAGAVRTALVAGAALFVGYWLGQRQATSVAQPQALPAVSSVASPPAPGSDALPKPMARSFPNMAPPIETATPAEVAALRQAEVVHSQASPPVATYTGPDGRQHAFRYQQTPAEEAAQRARADRQAALMSELQADPAAFAKKYGLRAREIERILDGSLPFPPELLD
jgi:hypothetical protein